jgi:hypothetical protein
MRKIATLLILIVIFLSGVLVWAQTEVADTSKIQSNVDWLWGEVVSVDVSANTLLVRYLDFNLDEEKELVVKIDTLTVLEGVKSVDEISAGDTVSIDFVKENATTNLGRKILVEKPESIDLITQPDSKSGEVASQVP